MGGCASKQDVFVPVDKCGEPVPWEHVMAGGIGGAVCGQQQQPSDGVNRNTQGSSSRYHHHHQQQQAMAKGQIQAKPARARDRREPFLQENRVKSGEASKGAFQKDLGPSKVDPSRPKVRKSGGSAATTTVVSTMVGSNGSNQEVEHRYLGRNVQFEDFKDREKHVVSNILGNNKHLSMAAISFKDLKLQKIIGTGAFGEVIRGTYCGTPVVVKRVLRNKIDENHIRMFGD